MKNSEVQIGNRYMLNQGADLGVPITVKVIRRVAVFNGVCERVGFQVKTLAGRLIDLPSAQRLRPMQGEK